MFGSSPYSPGICFPHSYHFAISHTGIANCGIGIALIHGLQRDPVAYWAAPAAAVLALLAVAAAALEVRRSKVRGAVAFERACRRPPASACT